MTILENQQSASYSPRGLVYRVSREEEETRKSSGEKNIPHIGNNMQTDNIVNPVPGSDISRPSIIKLNEVVLYGVPMRTKPTELTIFINKISSVTCTGNVRYSVSGGKITAFVEISKVDRERVINVFCNGHRYMNNSGIEGIIHSNYSYVKSAEYADNKIVLFHIPVGTTVKELEEYLEHTIGVSCADNVILRPTFISTKEAMIGYVCLQTNSDCEKVLKFVQNCNIFKNGNGIESKLSGNYFFKKKEKYTSEKENCVKSDDMLVLYYVPIDTSAEEIKRYLEETVGIPVVRDITFKITATSDKNMETLIAFVHLQADIDCEKLLESVKSQPMFTNGNGMKSKLSANHFFTKKEKYTSEKENCVKADDMIVLYYVPVDTSAEEIKRYLEETAGIPAVRDITFKITATSDKNMETLIAFVHLQADIDCEKLLESVKSQPMFTNGNGMKSKLSVNYFFKKREKYMSEKENCVKSDDMIVLYYVPVDTSAEEIKRYLEETAGIPVVRDITFKITATSDKNMETLTAFVHLQADIDCEKLLELVKSQPMFTNGNSIESKLSVNYFFHGKVIDDQIIIQNVPRDTTETEIFDLLQGHFSSIISVIKKIHLHDPAIRTVTVGNKKNLPLLTAFVTLSSKEDLNEIMSHFKNCEHGYFFQNRKGFKANLNFLQCFEKRKQTSVDLSDEQLHQVVIYNLPQETTKDEFVMFLTDGTCKVPVINIWLQTSRKHDGLLTAFLKIKAHFCDQIIYFFQKHGKADEYLYKNTKGYSSNIKRVCYNEHTVKVDNIIKERTEMCNDPHSSELVISNLPDSTTADEIIKLITENVHSVTEVLEIRMYEPEHPRKVKVNGEILKWYRLKAFIGFCSPQDLYEVHRFFKKEDGYWFRNETGTASRLYVQYVYVDYNKYAKRDKELCKVQSNGYKEKLDDPGNVQSEKLDDPSNVYKEKLDDPSNVYKEKLDDPGNVQSEKLDDPSNVYKEKLDDPSNVYKEKLDDRGNVQSERIDNSSNIYKEKLGDLSRGKRAIYDIVETHDVDRAKLRNVCVPLNEGYKNEHDRLYRVQCDDNESTQSRVCPDWWSPDKSNLLNHIRSLVNKTKVHSTGSHLS